MAAELAGNVQGAGLPIAGSTVTLYAAGTGAPTQLAQGKTDDNGAFKLDDRPSRRLIASFIDRQRRHGEGRGGQRAERCHRADGDVGHGVAEDGHGQ